MRWGPGLCVLLLLPLAQAGPFIDPSSCTPGAEFNFVVDRVEVIEFVGSFTVNVTRDGTTTMIDCSEDITIIMLPHDRKDFDEQAAGGRDYDNNPVVIPFEAQQKWGHAQITIFDDAIDEKDEWFILELDHHDEDAIGTRDDIEVKIIDDRGGFRFNLESQLIPLGDDNVTVRVDRVGETATAISAQVELSQPQHNASRAPDIQTFQVNFGIGDTFANINVGLLNDTTYQQQATLRLYDNAPSDRTFIGTPSRMLLAKETDPNLIDPEGAVARYDPPVFRVGEADGGVVVEVLRSGNTTRQFTVNYTTENGTADLEDYEGRSGVLTFSPGQTRKTFVISITDDDRVEGPETIWLRLFNPVNAQLAPAAAATIIILDDDKPAETATDTGTAGEEDSPTLPLLFVGALLAAVVVRQRRR